MRKRQRAYANLREYLEKTATPGYVFAEKLGVDKSTLSKILSGDRLPSLGLAAKIVREANIPIETLYPPEAR